MSKKCPKCGSVDIIPNGKYKDGSVGYKCRKCGEMFILLTLFNRITVSPEVLAPLLVYCLKTSEFKVIDSAGRLIAREDQVWASTILPGSFWTKYDEAIAATLAKLKEVEK